MPTYIGLLRGVNVGGNKMIRMSDLKSICESLGLKNVRTYLQSGNVVFSGKRGGLEEAIREATGVETKVIVRTPAEMRAVVESNPFPEKAQREPSRLLVYFLDQPLTAEGEAALRSTAAGGDEVHVAGREVYVYFGSGVAGSKLMALLTGKKLGAAATGRNWNTVTALLRLASGTDPSSR